MIRRIAILALMAGCSVTAVPASARPLLTTMTGKVISFDTQQQILTINSRVGPNQVLLDSRTLVLLNNRTVATTSIVVGDRAEVTYNYFTSVADTVQLFRQRKRTGTIVSATNNSIGLSVNGAVLNLSTDANSAIELANIPVNARSILVGRRATAVFEPGAQSQLLLSLAANSPTITRRLASVDVANRTITLGGTTPRTLALDTSATIRRGGQFVPISSLVAGDQLTIAFVRGRGTSTVLAINARPGAVTPGAAKRTK